MFRLFAKKIKEDPAYIEVAKWLDRALMQRIPENVVAFCFNLYEDEEYTWSMELVGTEQFDVDDPDWPCYEVITFGTREKPYVWKQKAKWDMIQEKMAVHLKRYLEIGKHAKKLKDRQAVGISFVDGDISILYAK